MRRVLLLLLLCPVVLLAGGVDGVFCVRWLEKEHSYGTFPEETGPQTAQLRFVNEGSAPVSVRKVRASCGCTDAAGPEGLVAPGDTAAVSVTYDPARRPGHFQKLVKVFFDGQDSYTTLKISGNVVGAEGSMSQQYPWQGGPLIYSARQLATDEVRHGSTRLLYLTAYNRSLDTVRPRVAGVREPLDVIQSEAVVGPGEHVSWSVHYDSRKEPLMGESTYSFSILAADGVEPFEVTVKASQLPDISHLSDEELRTAPRGVLQSDSLDLGTFAATGRKTRKCEIGIRNEGQRPMHVNRIYSPEPGIRAKSFPRELKAGRQAKAVLEIDLSQMPMGPFRIPVRVCVDDPWHPILSYFIIGNRAE